MEIDQSADILKILVDQLPHWVSAFAWASGLYIMTAWYGRMHLPEKAKESLKLWLRGNYKSTWTEHFCNAFDACFDKKHWSFRCFRRSAVVSLLSVFLLYLMFGKIFGFLGDENRMAGNLSFMQILLLGAVLNIIPDYLSLLETRWLLKRFSEVHSFWTQFSVLILDAIFTATIIWLAINIFQIATGNESLSIIKMLAVFSIYSVFFYSTFITSLWAWVYCISTWVMRLFSGTSLKNILAIEEKPVEQVALICSILLFLIIMIFQTIVTTVKRGDINMFDDFFCSISVDTCADVARISNNEKIALKYCSRLI